MVEGIATTFSHPQGPAGAVADVKRLQFRTRRILSADLLGQYRSAFRGSGLVYADLREYQPGDEVKSIHWKASARTGRVQVKSYEEDRLVQVMLVVDTSRSTLYGQPRSRHQLAFEFAGLISMLAHRNGDALGLCLFSDRVEEYMRCRHSRTQAQRVILSLLQHRELVPQSNLDAALIHVQRHMKRAGLVFVVSDFFCPPYADSLKQLAFKHDVIAVILEDPLRGVPPVAGLAEFVDAESGERFVFDTRSRRSRRVLQELYDGHHARIAQHCQQAQADHIIIRDNVLRPLVELMARRCRRQRPFHAPPGPAHF